MTRTEKAALLKCIQQGTASIEQLIPMQVYFITRCGESITINGKPSTDADAVKLEDEIHHRNKVRKQPHVIWNEIKTYL